MKKIFLLSSLLVCFLFGACVTWISDYPEPFEDYTYTEITLEEAKEIWSSFDLVHKKKGTVTVYTNSPERTRVFHNCQITGDSYYKYQIEVLSLVYEATVNLDEVREGTKFYLADQDPDTVKLVGSHAWYDSIVYVDGWITEARKDADFGWGPDHEYSYFKYR